MMNTPLILITNDDGYDAPGIRNLVNFVKDMGEIVVVAPDRPQSGMGHAITIASPLRINKLVQTDNYAEYTCSGTPADAVKLALDKVLPRKPDIILSGINHGSNASVNVIYSGTLGAAIEGALAGITSIGFSLQDFSKDADFLPARAHIRTIVAKALELPALKGKCLNVNIPVVSAEEIRGVKICRQAKANWIEEFEARKDPRNRNYYWLTGIFNISEQGEGTDEHALKNNYISMVPVTIDFTDYRTIDILNTLEFNV